MIIFIAAANVQIRAYCPRRQAAGRGFQPSYHGSTSCNRSISMASLIIYVCQRKELSDPTYILSQPFCCILVQSRDPASSRTFASAELSLRGKHFEKPPLTLHEDIAYGGL